MSLEQLLEKKKQIERKLRNGPAKGVKKELLRKLSLLVDEIANRREVWKKFEPVLA